MEITTQKFSTQPDLKSSNSIAKAMKKLAPMIKEANKRLQSIPLRAVPNPLTGADDLVRFATAEELQRIAMETCKGMVSVTTIPSISSGNEPMVTAFVLIATDDGFYQLPGSSASQKMSATSTVKTILAAESRAIRRGLRELGLRTESEIYDGDEAEHQMRIDESVEKEEQKAKDLDESKSEGSNVKTPANKTKATAKATAKTTRAKRSSPAKTDNIIEQKKEDANVEVQKPSSVLEPTDEDDFVAKDIVVNTDVEGWPNRHATSYVSKLIKQLEEVRCNKRNKGTNIETFAKRVLGPTAFGKMRGKRRALFTSLLTDELEKLYQYYVIGQDEI